MKNVHTGGQKVDCEAVLKDNHKAGNKVDWKAKWIWISDDPVERNLTICARRSFIIDKELKEPRIHITVDSRYVLYVNGRRVGQGPIRFWQDRIVYDTYDLEGLLVKGENIIAVQVVRWGVYTGQYVEGPGGLLAELEWKSGDREDAEEKFSVISDSSWKVRINTAYRSNVPRMTSQHAFSEQYDARTDMEGWTGAEYDDSGWQNAVELGPPGIDPWREIVPRPIPFLTEEEVYPVRVETKAFVEPQGIRYAFDMWSVLRPSGRPSNQPLTHGIIAALLKADADLEIVMTRMHVTNDMDLFGEMKVNGEEAVFDFDRARFNVKKGLNLLMVRFDREGQMYPSWVFESEGEDKCEGKIELLSPVGDPGGAIAVYPSERPDDTMIESLWQASSPSDLEPYFDRLIPLKPNDVIDNDVFALTVMQKPKGGRRPFIENEYAIASSNLQAAIVHSCTIADINSDSDSNGDVDSDEYGNPYGDINLRLDFGRELVGFLEFEIGAPEGTVLDWNLYEAEKDGRPCWMDNLNNTLRYTCRDGVQFYHSVVRRGFRYADLTIRGLKGSMKIRFVRCLLNTYPVTERGEFSCSDDRLNNIWKMGRYTTRLCMEDTYVDCPGYEQAFWLGDSRNEGNVARIAFGDTVLADRCLRLAAESLRYFEFPQASTPSGHLYFIPAWVLLWMIACEEHYRYSGDADFVKDIYPSIELTCRRFLEKIDDRGLFLIKSWNFIDWAEMDIPSDGVVTHQNALFALTLRRVARLAEIAGRSEDAEAFLSSAERLKDSINRYLWDDGAKAYLDSIHADGSPSRVFSQQTQVMVYLTGCADEEKSRYIEGYITEAPCGWIRIGSPFMMFFQFEDLAKLGRHELILDLIRKYWGQMLDFGSTTCWEAFPGSFTGRWNPTRSYCHAWSSAPTYFLSVYQLGIRLLDEMTEPGCRRILVAPEPAGLKWAKGRVPTPHGDIIVEWSIDDDGGMRLDVRAPEEVDIEVKTPSGIKAARVVVNGEEYRS